MGPSDDSTVDPKSLKELFDKEGPEAVLEKKGRAMVEDAEPKRFLVKAAIDDEVLVGGVPFRVGSVMAKSMTLISGPGVTMKKLKRGQQSVIKELT